MKITNNHKGPLGLPDGTILPPGEATTIANWDALKGNAVVQGWLQGKILSAEGSKASAPAQESLLGSNVLPANIELAEGVSVQLGEVVRRAHVHSGLSVADWNALEDADREAELAAMVRELQAAAEAEAEARKGEGAAAAGEAGKTKASAGTGTQNPPAVDKDALLARAKELEIDANRTWGVPKLQAAIAEAEARKGEG
ncbi:MAG: hypothetical protein KH046_00825 [Stenotrophomonas maltophilia]|uniref:hypothetical protein n=1 Tax=Stenotrophomonas maltophilia TaxID=40324 RepID=UPI0013DCD3A8|nr:hypothetical protein [Stenotrophomonas maltophilia]MBS4799364.1 hypothetical protein [Stenotrophomonas maltophilia]